MSPLKDLYKIARAGREEVERKLGIPDPDDPEAHAGELLGGQRWRRARAWFSRELDAWTERLERGGKWAKHLAIFVTSLATVGAVLWRAVVFYTSRGGAPAEQPATGVASTTIDRVEKPSSKP
jgi:hypothetical protein